MSKILILSAHLCFHVLGMTMEVLGTLIGAALQGQIVASAHVSPHCTVNPSLNTTDSWHDTPSIPDPSDPLSHQVSVYGNTLKYIKYRKGWGCSSSTMSYPAGWARMQLPRNQWCWSWDDDPVANNASHLCCLCNPSSVWQQNFSEELCRRCQTCKVAGRDMAILCFH